MSFLVVRETLKSVLRVMPKYRQKQNQGPVSCAYCKTMFSNAEHCNWHVELVKQCRRRLTKKATANLKQKTNRDDDCDSKEFLEEVDVKEMVASVWTSTQG